MNKRLVGPCFVALFVLLTAVYQPAQGYKSGPRDVYHQAWSLVRDNYYDSSFNGQNWSAWEHKFDNDIHTVADAHKAVKSMLESLKDPYTRFLDPRAFQDENDAIDSRIVGIGINLLQKDQKLMVTRTIDNSPAANAGMREKDEIIAIDGLNSVGFTPEQAAEKIRGQAGMPVKISIRRPNGEEHTFNIVRA